MFFTDMKMGGNSYTHKKQLLDPAYAYRAPDF